MIFTCTVCVHKTSLQEGFCQSTVLENARVCFSPVSSTAKFHLVTTNCFIGIQENWNSSCFFFNCAVAKRLRWKGKAILRLHANTLCTAGFCKPSSTQRLSVCATQWICFQLGTSKSNFHVASIVSCHGNVALSKFYSESNCNMCCSMCTPVCLSGMFRVARM